MTNASRNIDSEFAVLADLIGPEGIASLVRKLGGTTVYVPSKAHEKFHGYIRLRDAIGHDLAVKVIETFAGCSVAVPQLQTTVSAQYFEKYAKLLKEDPNILARVAARLLGINERSVRRYKALLQGRTENISGKSRARAGKRMCAGCPYAPKSLNVKLNHRAGSGAHREV